VSTAEIPVVALAPLPVLDVFVFGRPVSKGSITRNRYGAAYNETKGLDTWQDSVRAACIGAWEGQSPLDGQVEVDLQFILPRPAAAPKRRTPPAIRKPDLDKLVRAIYDAITSAGVWVDDARVVRSAESKRLAEIGEAPGARIKIYRIEDVS
jgi:crossover junction endodeoxyribonuclease RusA